MIKTDIHGNVDAGLSEKTCSQCGETFLVAHRVLTCNCGGVLTTIRSDITTNELRRRLMGLVKK